MPLVKEEPKVTVDNVLAQLEEAEIWYAYFGPFEIGQITHSVFREDKHPSTGFYLSRTGRIVYNDLATSEKLDCFAFVAKKNNITYGQAVRQVACEFGLIDCGTKKFTRGVLTAAQLAAKKVRRHTEIEIVPERWNEANLAYWERYHIDQDELMDNDVFPVKKLFVNGRIAPNYSKQQRYAYIMNIQGRSYKKIYTPLASQKDFKWVTNIPLKIPFGINTLPLKSDRLIIAKAQKDRILFKKFFTDVIATQNESPSSLNATTIAYIKKHYKYVTVCPDPDPTGVDFAKYCNNSGFDICYTPDKAQAKGIKDFADFVEKYGLKWFEKYLKLKQLI
jgi:hypothetical protein